MTQLSLSDVQQTDSDIDTSPPSNGELRTESHEQTSNWRWSREFAEFIDDRLEGRSLNICAGLSPVADVNIDIADLREMEGYDDVGFQVVPITDDERAAFAECFSADADTDALYGRLVDAEGTTTTKATASPPDIDSPLRETAHDNGLYSSGVVCQGDMFGLPFPDGAFDSVVEDPPWRDLSLQERAEITTEATRVADFGGLFILNAPWIPEDDHLLITDIRFRQQRHFWGSPSFVSFCRVHPASVEELLAEFGHTLSHAARRVSPNQIPGGLHPEFVTDPRIVDPGVGEFACPMCNCPALGQLVGDHHPHAAEDAPHRFDLYECADCGFRATKSEVLTEQEIERR